ncbi:unnamed protein product [Ranitomeya imitator]|uniref:Uncharacterized protein n=1 Tax=Ranitomeya imitator TaxID=111125 RepID=A0ABN9LJI5_9NEOB|nr:unnamed protein product [Ranitomeya imitator]
MYLASFSLRTLVAVKGYVSCNDDPDSFICSYYTKSERSEWNTEDPQFIAEVLFACDQYVELHNVSLTSFLLIS